jgi:hypothetical protein
MLTSWATVWVKLTDAIHSLAIVTSPVTSMFDIRLADELYPSKFFQVH